MAYGMQPEIKSAAMGQDVIAKIIRMMLANNWTRSTCTSKVLSRAADGGDKVPGFRTINYLGLRLFGPKCRGIEAARA